MSEKDEIDKWEHAALLLSRDHDHSEAAFVFRECVMQFGDTLQKKVWVQCEREDGIRIHEIDSKEGLVQAISLFKRQMIQAEGSEEAP